MVLVCHQEAVMALEIFKEILSMIKMPMQSLRETHQWTQ